MNYLDYVDYLVDDFLLKKAETQKMYDTMLRSREYLDRSKNDIYLQHVNDCHAVANLAEHVMRNLMSGNISPYDEID